MPENCEKQKKYQTIIAHSPNAVQKARVTEINSHMQ